MNGTRVEIEDGMLSILEKPGSYGYDPKSGFWWCHAPSQPGQPTPIGNLANHTITEHEDGTITVSPSILISTRRDGADHVLWHGYLERGAWREC